MPRTRDLLLVGTVVCFLLVAIGGTVLSRFHFSDDTSTALTSTPPADYTASIAESAAPTRAERLEAMRVKIAAEQETVALSAPVEEVVIEDEELTEATTSPEVTAVVECVNYQTYRGLWNPAGVSFMESEGVRVVFRESAVLANASGTPQIDTLLQLPIRLFSDAQPQCIGSDVIGIAQDGSLIRNNEVGLYGVFGPDTLIGYALDGFPIYGTAGIQTDSCGGTVVAGQYRYYISGERDTVLGCFTAPPVSLP